MRPGTKKTFNVGCNECTCGEDGQAVCTEAEELCEKGCPYKNWDLIPGLAKKGNINAWDEEEGCPKQCKCKVKKGKGFLQCRRGPDDCIYF